MGSPKSVVVKRGGRRPTEHFNQKKLTDSIYAACLSVGAPEGQAEMVANSVSEKVMTWLEKKPEVTSDDLRRKAAQFLSALHPDAAHLYKHHHLVI